MTHLFMAAAEEAGILRTISKGELLAFYRYGRTNGDWPVGRQFVERKNFTGKN